MEKILILGGGYGGLRITQRLLSHDLPNDVSITIVDRLPYHCLKTEYYALAAGTESDSALRVAFPSDSRVNVVYGSVKEIDLESKQVYLEDENAASLTYDYLVIGLGCVDRYHGVPGADKFTCSIQSMDNTRKTYQVLNNVKPNGKVAIVGGGLSGVEIAAELRESRSDLTIQIYDRGESILSPYPEKLRKYVREWFTNRSVDLIHKANITKVEPNKLYNHDEEIELDAIVWTAGIQANPIVQALPVEKDPMGRVHLTKYHAIPNYENAYVVGDCASLPFAPSAQLAEAQGDQIAMIISSIIKGQSLPDKLPKMKLKGTLGSLGKKHGFGQMGGTTLIGRVPRVLKSGVLWMYKNHLG
ncbi:NAD(P)/FAD-dependent oxidoreductase [Bacillus horti]|uniref:NADH dehydrogenase n=1 Tax=Caldalkalibacillus horti TaxID=77523 RepID=A0ABT9VU45_9BACI|nr:NAD(P)/FAD-dependent oxidoreductase [Bacillus horti]MDQ0164405.1 NADH dehydrogenase [Bacillus horti]